MCSIPWAREYARTHFTCVASGLAPIPSRSTCEPAGPSSFFACSRAVVVSGQIVVHFGSLNASTTTLPRNELSETRLPNWSVSVKPGAAALSRAPGSRSGFAIPGVCVADTGVDGVVLEGRATEMTIPMPTPTASAIPRTVHCSRRDTSLQYAPRGIALMPVRRLPLAGTASLSSAAMSARREWVLPSRNSSI